MKARISKLIDKIFFTPRPLPPGLYQSITEIDGTPNRLHLRIQKEGNGILILNAATILHLNPTAAEIVFHIIKKTPEEEIVDELIRRYQVSKEEASLDVENIKIRLESLIRTPDLDPETFLDMESTSRHSTDLETPLRLDCALTYQVPDGHSNLYSPVDRVKHPLSSEEWMTILTKSWEAGIPHVVFTGGEPTLRPDLIDLIRKSEELGQVSGLITDGNRLAEKDYLYQLLQAGLDHVMLILDPSEKQSYEAIRDVLAEDLFLTVHLTISPELAPGISEILQKLQKMGVKNLSISSSSADPYSSITNVSEMAINLGFCISSDLPVPYSRVNPFSSESDSSNTIKDGAGISWIYCEPDGDILPSQGSTQVLGNLLTEPWLAISANRKLNFPS